MTRKEALAELIAKVEAGGNKWSAHQVEVATGGAHQAKFYQAYHGSLDAAKALHKAVLPGWPYTIENVTGQTFRAWTDQNRGLRRPGFAARNGNPARAWLLAILKALHAQEPE